VNQPVDAHLDTGTPDAIFEGIDPVPIDLRHQYTHIRSVVYGLQLSSSVSGGRLLDQ
jgi:hypothetical protein